VLDLIGQVPTPAWGRDELATGDMWNSNSVIAWVIALQRVKSVVTVPVAVKLSPYFSSMGEMALRLDEAGADALVLFNRFLQPDIDPEELALSSTVALSSTADARLPRTWIALLRGQVRLARTPPPPPRSRPPGASKLPPTSPSTCLPAPTS
jgi:hypothetical protein